MPADTAPDVSFVKKAEAHQKLKSLMQTVEELQADVRKIKEMVRQTDSRLTRVERRVQV